jgi:sugar/nucleoside kinase (ribokinase family)
VLAEFRPVVPEEFKSAEIVILGNLHPFVQTSVLNQIIKKPKCIILDTMNFWMDNSLTELLEVISRTDVLVINDEEAKQLSQQESLFTAADEILKMGPKYLVIKKGEHGAMLFGDSQFFTSPAFPVKEVIDPTGAGDTFAGGFGGYLSESTVINFEILKSAIAYGTVMASFCVEKFGTMAMENLKKEKVLERLKVFKKYTAYSL